MKNHITTLNDKNEDMKKTQASRAENKILPTDFFSCESEKTKLNWFFFEYAEQVQSRIGRPLMSKLKKKRIGEKKIAKFCIHYAKQMEGPIIDKLSGRAHNMVLSYEPIEEFFPNLNDKLIDKLLTAVGNAWEGMLEMCERCPTRCISEKEKRATMFDDPSYYD